MAYPLAAIAASNKMRVVPEKTTPFLVSNLESETKAVPKTLPINLRTRTDQERSEDEPQSFANLSPLASVEMGDIISNNKDGIVIGDDNQVSKEIEEELDLEQQVPLESISYKEGVKIDRLNAQKAQSSGETYIQVTNSNDSGSGSLRSALSTADASNDDVLIDIRGVNGVITLQESLPTVTGTNKIWVVGDGNDRISGGNNQQILSVNKTDGFLAFFGVTLQNGKAQGGNGSQGGGGGLGAGAALFINKGNVVVDQSVFENNQAIGGNSTQEAGTGGDVDRSGTAGGVGGKFNQTSTFSSTFTPGSGGSGGLNNEDSGGNGGAGQFGTGGGGGGGGAGGGKGGSDSGGNGGAGGKGGFGAGGGGAGGGGNDEDFFGGGEPGAGGTGGVTNGYGGNGHNGNSGGGNRQGGIGGGGAGLGGAIFVRETNSAHLQLSNSEFSNNSVSGGSGNQSGQAKGNAIFASGNESSGSDDAHQIIDNQANVNYVTDTDGELPTLSLSLVDLDRNDLSNPDLGDKQYKLYEGDRIKLRLSIEGGTLPEDHPVYFYLSQTDTRANHGSSDQVDDIDQQTDADFAWDGKIVYELLLQKELTASEEFYLTMPYPSDPTWSNGLDIYSGIQTYIDKLVEGDEDLTIDLLPGEGYQLTTEPSVDGTPGYSQQVIIEDINYQVELLDEQSNTEIADVADALAPKPSIVPLDGSTIDLTNLQGLGYVTVQARRPINVKHAPDQDELSNNDWVNTEGQYDGTVNGDFFNNALAGGLAIHYTLTPIDGGEAGEDYFSNQLNYRNERYGEQQIYDAVVIPATKAEEDRNSGDLPPGQARIYFAALPDAVQENPEHYTLTIETFTDPSYNPDEDFCGEDEGPKCNSVLQNTPAGDYQFYKVRSDAKEATFILYDSGEFTAGLVIADYVNQEVVDQNNPLVPKDDGTVNFWVKLGSQPTGDVTVTYDDGQVLNFTPQDWSIYQSMTATNIEPGDSITFEVNGADYSDLDRTITLADQYDHFKVTEGAIPDLSQRTVTLGVAASVETAIEGQSQDPKFVISLGQPLPEDLEIEYEVEPANSELSGIVTLPKYQQRVSVPYPVPDDNIVEPAEEPVILTLKSDNLPEGVTITEGSESAQFTLKDNDKARVLIKKHLPAQPTEGDVALFLPEFYFTGQRGDRSLVVHSFRPGLEDLVIVPEDMEIDTPDDLKNYGLLREVAVDLEEDNYIETVDFDRTYISFPENGANAKIETFSTGNFSLSDLPTTGVMRLSGQLEIPEAGDYTFSINDDISGQAELWINGSRVAKVPSIKQPTSQHLEAGLSTITVLYLPTAQTPQKVSHQPTSAAIEQIKITPGAGADYLQLSEVEAYGETYGFPGDGNCDEPSDCDLALSDYDATAEASSVFDDSDPPQDIIDTVIDGSGPDSYPEAYSSAEQDTDPNPYLIVTLPDPEPLLQLTIIEEGTNSLDDSNIYNVELLDEQGQTVFQASNLSAVGDDIDRVTITDFGESGPSPLTISWNDEPIPADALRFPALGSGFSVDPYIPPSNYVSQLKIMSAYEGEDKTLQISEVIATDAEGNDLALSGMATVSSNSQPADGTALENIIDGQGPSDESGIYRSSADNGTAEVAIALNHPALLESVEIQGWLDEESGKDIYSLELVNAQGQVISYTTGNDANNDSHAVEAFTEQKVKRIRVTPGFDPKLTVDKHLTIDEVEALDKNGNNLALLTAGATATASSSMPGSQPINAIDGEVTGDSESSYQSLPKITDEHLLIDLAYPSDIATLSIYAPSDIDQDNQEYIVELLNEFDRVLATFPVNATANNLGTVHVDRLTAQLRITPFNDGPLQISEIEATGILDFQTDLANYELGAKAEGSEPLNPSTLPINAINQNGPEVPEQENYISADQSGHGELLVTLPHLDEIDRITLQGRAATQYDGDNVYNLELLNAQGDVIKRLQEIEATSPTYEGLVTPWAEETAQAQKTAQKNTRGTRQGKSIADTTINEMSVLPSALDFLSATPVTSTTRFQAIITPPETGEYTFALASNSDSRLFVERLESFELAKPTPFGARFAPKHKPIAYIDGDEGQRDFPERYQWQWSRNRKTLSQEQSRSQSQPMFLQAGKQYLLSAQLDPASEDATENGIPSFLAVAWQQPSGTGLELLKTMASKAVPVTEKVLLPLKLSTLPNIGDDDLVHTSIEIPDPTITLGAAKYKVARLTLEGDPAYDYPNSATPHIPSTFIPFASGFMGYLAQPITLTPNQPVDIALEPLDSAIPTQTLNLSEGEKGRVSFQLEGAPGLDTVVHVQLMESTSDGSISQAPDIELYCGDEFSESGEDCKELTFDADNWNQPQYMMIEGVNAGLDESGHYDPELSYINLATVPEAEVAQGLTTEQIPWNEYSFIRINLFPDQLEDFAVYHVRANDDTLSGVEFVDPTGSNLPTISYTDPEGHSQDFTENWTWEMDGQDLVAKHEGTEILRLVAHEEALPPGTPDQAVQLTAKAIVSSVLFEETDLWQGTITIEGLQIEAIGDKSTSTVPIDLTLERGNPTIELHNVLTGELPFDSVKTVQYLTTLDDIIEVGVNEPLLTEYGVLIYDSRGHYVYEANPRPQPAQLSLTAISELDSEADVLLDLTAYQTGVQLITGLLGSADGSQPLAKAVVTTPSVNEESETATVTITLEEPATEAVLVSYTIAQSDGQNPPFDEALSLSPISDKKFALELPTDDNTLIVHPWNFTAEFWLSYTNTINQGLLTGINDDGSTEATLIQIDNGTLKFPGYSDLNVSLSDLDITPNQAFHVAYRSSSEGQAVFINGRKQKATEQPLTHDFNALKAIGRDEYRQYFTGNIDEVRLWTVPRSDQEIRNNYRNTVLDSNDQNGLAGYWRFQNQDLDNEIESGVTIHALDEDQNEVTDLNTAWRIRTIATECVDYTLPDSVCSQHNLFDLDAGMLGGRTTFAIADFDNDQHLDAILVDGHGQVTLHHNQGMNPNGRPTFKAKSLPMNLGEAVPITAGDLDHDGDIDLVFGTPEGEVKSIENKGSKGSARFQTPRTLTTDGATLRFSGVVAPTLADLDGDGVSELITLDRTGEMGEFKLTGKPRQGILKRKIASGLPKLLSSNQSRFAQFVDLDHDGDLDLLVDNLRNQPGQRGGGHRYYANYGTPESPYFVEAPHSAVAVALRGIDTKVTYGNRTIKTPYDQAQFYQFADWNGNGTLTLLQSDNKGEIHLRSEGSQEHVAIIPPEEQSVDIPITLISDDTTESLEYVQIQLAQQDFDDLYHIETGTDQGTVEITESSLAGDTISSLSSTVFTSTEPGDLQVLDDSQEAVNWEVPIEVSEVSTQPIPYHVSLTTQPSSDVQLTITSSQPRQGLVAIANNTGAVPGTFKESVTLYFSKDDWNTPQPFWLQGVDDQMDDQDATYGYVLTTRSSDSSYSNILRVLQSISTENDDVAGMDWTFDTLPEAALAEGALYTTEGAINTVKVNLTSKPTQPVTVTLDPADKEITFYPQRRIISAIEMESTSRKINTTRALPQTQGNCDLGDGENDGTLSHGTYGELCWRANGDFSYTQTVFATEEPIDVFSFSVDNGYGLVGGESLTIPVTSQAGRRDETQPKLVMRHGNLFFNGNELAGQPMTLTFTPEDWNLDRTVAVAAIDDDVVEYNRDSLINVLLSDPGQTLYGSYGTLSWTAEGNLTYTLAQLEQLDPGEYSDIPIYLTYSDDAAQNHTLDLVVSAIAGEDPDWITTYTVHAIQDQNTDNPLDFIEDTDNPGTFSLDLELDPGVTITGMAHQLLDPAYQATGGAQLRVNIEDNDIPIVRAGIDLNATENTNPGYFSFSVLEPVGIPGGLPVHYTVYGAEDEGALMTAERIEENNGDPGPDLQGFEEINSGTLYIPEGKTRVVFPIFPIDDFTPEESLAARYEKVLAVIEPPTEEDLYQLDQLYPENQTAAVRIIDNEEVGLKVVIPANGLNIDEEGFNGIRVGLMSQPQKPVDLEFYYNDIRSDNQRDLTFLDIDSVNFTNSNWNQWQTVNVRLFGNLTENRDDLHPRYTDLYYTLGAGTDEPFYNTLKGALNQTGAPEDTEATVIEGTVTMLNSNPVPDTTTAEGTYGTLTLTDVAQQYLGDFTYALDEAETEQLIQDIKDSGIDKVFDEFTYTITPNSDEEPDLEQKVAVEIAALNHTELSEDQVAEELFGDYGTLTLNVDGTFTYVLDESTLPTDENWSIHDSFVYILETPPADEGEPTIQGRYALNLVVTQDTDIDDNVTIYARGNGGSVNSCDTDETPDDPTDDPTVCDGIVSGNVIAADIENPDFLPEEIPQPTVIKVGRTTLEPVVTAMTLRDANDVDLMVDGAPLYANSLFMAMPLNRTEDFVLPGATLNGEHGTLALHENGFYSYTLDREALVAGLEDYEQRTVHDRFVYTLSNRGEKVLQLVTTYDVETDTITVTANDRSSLDSDLTLDSDGGNTFIGNLISQTEGEEPITITGFGLATTSVHPQEKALDPIVVRDGLTQVLSNLQGNFNNVSVPVMGRLGGGGTGDISGSSAEAQIPDFADRVLSILETELTKYPHLTTAELEKALTKALQETFASFGVPLIVLKFDTEKLLLKLAFGFGGTIAQFEAASDWGNPGLGKFSASGALGYQLAIDVVFGIQFRHYEEDPNNSSKRKFSPAFFIVTSQEKLNSLIEPAQTKPTELHVFRTWAGKTVPQNGIIFTQTQTSGTVSKPKLPDNFGTLEDQLWEDSNSTLKMDWEWAAIPGYRYKDGYPFVEQSKKYSYAQIVGYVYYVDDDAKEKGKAKFVEISLVQPDSIGANSGTKLVISAIADPDHLLQTVNDKSVSRNVQNVRDILTWFADKKKTIEFLDREIIATSLASDRAKMEAYFEVSFKKKTDSSTFSTSPQTFSASVEIKGTNTYVNDVSAGQDYLPFSTQYTSSKQIILDCEKQNPCKSPQITLTERELAGGHTETFEFPLRDETYSIFAHGQQSFSDKKDLKYGTVEATATLKGSQVYFSWRYSPKAKDKLLDDLERIDPQCSGTEFKNQKCEDNRGYKDIALEVKPKKNGGTTQIDEFRIMDGTLAFAEEGKESEPASDAVSKVSGELFAISDFVGGISLYVLEGSINQAVTPPTEVPVNTTNPQRDPAEAYQQLVAKYSARQNLVEISEQNADENSQAFIVASFGVLGLAQDGSYSYSFKPEMREENVAEGSTYPLVFNANPPTTHDEAADQVLLNQIVGDVTAPDSTIWWNDPNQPTTIKFNGYTIECPSFYSFITNSLTLQRIPSPCQVDSPYVLMSTSSFDELVQQGVPSLESAIVSTDDAEGVTGWEESGNLSNRITLVDLKQCVSSGAGNAPCQKYNITNLQDVFFIANNLAPGYDKLVITYKTGNELEAKFLENTLTNFDTSTPGVWKGTDLYVSSPFAIPLEASSGKINPMAKARLYLDVALRSTPKNGGQDPGVLQIGGGNTNIKDAQVQFTVGGEAALFAQINVGFGFIASAFADSNNMNSDPALGYQIPAPNISTKLGLTAHYTYTVYSSPTYHANGGEITFGVYDLGLDLGSLISEKLAGPLGDFSNLVEPAQPIINAVTADTKIFAELGLVSTFDLNGDGIVTILEIPTPFIQAGVEKSKYASQLNTLLETMQILASLLQMYQVVVDLGNELSGAKALSENIISTDGFMTSPTDIRINPWQPSNASGTIHTISKYLVPYVDNFGHVVLGTHLSYQYGKTHNSKVTDQEVKNVDTQKPQSATNDLENSKNSSIKKVKSGLQKIQNLGFISLPILSNPLNLLQLIFGDPAELIVLNVPAVDLNFPITKTFKIYGILSGIFQAELDLELITQVGIDTAGLQQVLCGESPTAIWNCFDPDHVNSITGEDVLKLINMIYLRDWSEQSYMPGGDYLLPNEFWRGVERVVSGKSVVDKHELGGNALTELGVGVEVLGLGTFMQGGIGIGGGFDLIDLCEPESPEPCPPPTEGSPAVPSYDGKIRAYDFFVTQLGNSPIEELFSALFELYASLEIAITLFGAEVADINIGRFKLYEFSFAGANFIPVGVNTDGHPLVGSTVFFDANGNGLPDAGEPMDFTDSQGRAALHVPYKFFDKNRDGVIDERDGRIVMLDGVDAITGMPQLDPLVAIPQAHTISPMTTLVSGLVDEGLSVDQALDQVQESFELPATLDLLGQGSLQHTLNREAPVAQVVITAQQQLEALWEQSEAKAEGKTTIARRQTALHSLAHRLAH
ncbi:FG-GAP-like repeat-containing protein [Moorena producens]|uniref:FG-GAP-like repeat-containing protein n=1 Tax=Moorena producens TaxID=1155739 RepID=UPI003C753370